MRRKKKQTIHRVVMPDIVKHGNNFKVFSKYQIENVVSNVQMLTMDDVCPTAEAKIFALQLQLSKKSSKLSIYQDSPDKSYQ